LLRAAHGRAGYHWPHETDLAALRAGRALTELVSRCVERGVGRGQRGSSSGEALGVADPEAVFGPAVAGWTEELARVRAG
jgi:hypothetical protein